MSECRLFLLKNIHFEIIVANLPKVFEDASVDSLIFVGTKEIKTTPMKIEGIIDRQFYEKHLIYQSRFLNNSNYVFTVEANAAVVDIIDRITAVLLNSALVL